MEDYTLRFDAKRRTTWPAALLAEAGVAYDDEMVARPDPDHPGRIIVETRQAIKARVHARAARGRDAMGQVGSTADELIAERRADASLG